MPEIEGQCPSEEEMDKELELMLIEKYWLGQLALKIWKEAYELGHEQWFDEGKWVQ